MKILIEIFAFHNDFIGHYILLNNIWLKTEMVVFQPYIRYVSYSIAT
jgi:hypothetical protein